MTEEQLELSPAEKQLLRGFFHRQALPYAALTIAVAALVGVSTQGLLAIDSGPDPEAAPPPPAIDLAAFETTQAAAEGLLVELRQAAQRDQDGLAAAKHRMGALEKRLAGAQEQLQALEAQAREAAASIAATPAPAAPPAAPATRAAPADSNDVLEWFYKLEIRQEQVEARSAKLGSETTASVKAILDRLYNLEARTTTIEQVSSSAAPAAPDPSTAP